MHWEHHSGLAEGKANGRWGRLWFDKAIKRGKVTYIKSVRKTFTRKIRQRWF